MAKLELFCTHSSVSACAQTSVVPKKKLLHVKTKLVKVLNVRMNGYAQKLIMVVKQADIVPVWFSCAL